MPFRAASRSINGLRDTLLDAMWEDAGIIRDAPGLTRVAAKLDQFKTELLASGVPDDNRAFNLTWHDWLNLRSLIETSQVITQAALKRENSRGAHFRTDFPEPGDLATSRYTIARQAGETLTISDAPVIFSLVKPGETLLKDPIAAE